MIVDVDTITRILTETATSEVLPRFQALAEGEIREKAGGDLVTVADEQAETVLASRLRDMMPGSVVLGEEAAASDPDVIEYLAGEDPVWVIDPVDGTGNFARGVEPFAVMLALVRHGETCAAWIHEPMSGRVTVATHGGGTWVNGYRISIPPSPTDTRSMQGTLHAGTHGSRDLVRRLDKRRDRVGVQRSLRCAGAEYTRLARGEQHFSVFTKLAPWDHAPGSLILTEAGGVARLSEGRDYSPLVRKAEALLLAPGEESWARLYELLLRREAGE